MKDVSFGSLLIWVGVAMLLFWALGDKPAPVAPTPAPVVVPVAKPVVYMFSADWCVYCKQFEQKVLTDQAVKDALNLFDFRIINSDSDKVLVAKFKVKSLPHFVSVDDDRRHSGYMNPKEFVQWLQAKTSTAGE